MPTEKQVITNEMIAARAYERYVERGRENGHDIDDWLAAEGELRSLLGGGAGAEPLPAPRSLRPRASNSARS